MSPLSSRSLLIALLLSLHCAAGCSSISGNPRPLDAEELEGVDRILAVTDAWGRAEERGAEVAQALRSARAQGRLFRSPVARASIMGVTRDDEIHFAERAALRRSQQDESLNGAYIALSVAVHEGWHLRQGVTERVLGRPEEEAYRETAIFERWLLGAWVDGHPAVRDLLPADDLEALGRTLHNVRPRTGGGFLDDLDPVHILDRSFEIFRRRRGQEIELPCAHAVQRWPLRRDPLRVRETGEALLPLPGSVENSNFLIRLTERQATFPEDTVFSDPGNTPTFEIGWFLVRERKSGRDVTELFARATRRVVYDDAVPSRPRLRIFGPLPRGDYDVIWTAQRLRDGRRTKADSRGPYTQSP